MHVLACPDAHYDAATGTCAEGQAIWIPQPSLLPQLSAADGASIAWAIFAFWMSVYLIKQLRKHTANPN